MLTKKIRYIKIPGSKSISNRALLIAALAEKPSTLENLLFCDDTLVMIDALKTLGCSIDFDQEHNKAAIRGGGYLSMQKVALQKQKANNKNEESCIYIDNAGTAGRFLLPLLSLLPSSFVLTGCDRMSNRPFVPLVEAINSLGGPCEQRHDDIGLPIYIAKPSLKGGNVALDSSESSQFLSALLLLAPYFPLGLNLQVCGKRVSKSYIAMTVAMMRSFGVEVLQKQGAYSISANQHYRGQKYFIEGDASSASYFLVAAAILNETVELHGICRESLQGDLKIIDDLKKMGCSYSWRENTLNFSGCSELKPLQQDLNDRSDIVPSLAIACLFADGTSYLYNIAHMRLKECDRIQVLQEELSKLGAKIICGDDYIKISGRKNEIPKNSQLKALCLNTYNDHRMAMSFSILSLRSPSIKIDNPLCVSKTFPDFFSRFNATYHDLHKLEVSI